MFWNKPVVPANAAEAKRIHDIELNKAADIEVAKVLKATTNIQTWSEHDMLTKAVGRITYKKLLALGFTAGEKPESGTFGITMIREGSLLELHRPLEQYD